MIHALQFCATSNAKHNFERVAEFINTLPAHRPCLVSLPESWLCFAKSSEQVLEVARQHQYWRQQLSLLCQKEQVWLAAGTIPVMSDTGRYYAASILFDAQGRECAQYNKIHLFDVTVSDNTGNYHESKHTQPGEHIVVADVLGTKVGLSVCYDMRFSELYRAQVELGANVLLVPSAFTVPTGRAHWHTLLRARAIESQAFVVAAGLYGRNDTDIAHDNGRQTYGHSLIISPWGEIISECHSGEGWISATVDMNELNQCRERMPMHAHRQARKVKL
ncbi:carbon-nitrogen hydrolase family protein [Pseudoalteromonas sp. SSDWG2]|uniref:carbon-nitrogen hydrolase family protein n=1 Tax=Pseudoalteromonas sp. SSDWG2 TaxID=3139391 RepID=UPI003BAD615D